VKGLLYYSSKYGTTRRIGQWICSAVSCAEVTATHIGNDIKNHQADFYIVGIPIYVGKPISNIIDSLQSMHYHTGDKPLFLYIVSWAQSTPFYAECDKFIELAHWYLRPCRPVLSRSLPGWLELAALDPDDRRVMKRLLRRLDTISDEFDSDSIVFADQSDERLSKQFGCDINEWLTGKSGLF